MTPQIKRKNDVLTDHVLDALSKAQANFEVIDCDPELADTAAFCDHYGYALDESANAILVAGK